MSKFLASPDACWESSGDSPWSTHLLGLREWYWDGLTRNRYNSTWNNWYPLGRLPTTTSITESEARLKFVDDLSIAECTPSNVTNQETLQTRLESINLLAKLHDIKLNLKKSKLMQFTFSRKQNILPNITLEGANLDFVNETKLLGLTITNNCKWDANT